MTRRTAVYAIAAALLLIAADGRPPRLPTADDWARHWGPFGLPAYGHVKRAPLVIGNTWDTAVRDT